MDKFNTLYLFVFYLQILYFLFFYLCFIVAIVVTIWRNFLLPFVSVWTLKKVNSRCWFIDSLRKFTRKSNRKWWLYMLRKIKYLVHCSTFFAFCSFSPIWRSEKWVGCVKSPSCSNQKKFIREWLLLYWKKVKTIMKDINLDSFTFKRTFYHLLIHG